MLGAMELISFLYTFLSLANNLISSSSSLSISISSNVCSTISILLVSAIKSYLVEGTPLFNGTGTSFIMPIILTLLPGVVFLSITGSTKSSFKKTESLFGCSPPSNDSGDSSRTKRCASTKSFDNNLNFPLLPQVHLVGSLNLVSICNIVMVLPQEGHSNLADVT